MDITNIRASELAMMINKELKKKSTLSVNKVCESLGLKASSVKTKFRRAGYIYDQEQRQYLEVQYEEQPTNNIEPIENHADGSESNFNNSGGINSPLKVEPLTDGEITAIRNLLLQAQDKGKFEISYKHSNDDIITRNIKLSKELNTRLLQFIAKLPPHRLLDLYNTIFEQFLDKYEE